MASSSAPGSSRPRPLSSTSQSPPPPRGRASARRRSCAARRTTTTTTPHEAWLTTTPTAAPPPPGALGAGDAVAEAVGGQARVGPAARGMSELEGDQRAAARGAVEEAFRPLDQGDGLHMGSAVWVVSAKA